MKTAQEIEQTLRAIILGDGGDDPMLRQMFVEMADGLAPHIAHLAAVLAPPPPPEPLPRPRTVREAKQQMRKAKRELARLEEGIARGEYRPRDEVVAEIERVTHACSEHIRRGVREARRLFARGGLQNEAQMALFLQQVIEDAIALLAAPFGLDDVPMPEGGDEG